MLFEVEVAPVVEHAVEHEGRVAIGALDRAACRRGVAVGDEGVELERDVVEARAVGPLQHLLRPGEALPVAGRCRAVAPTACGVKAGDAVDDGGDEEVGEPDRAAAGVEPAVQFVEAVRLRRVGGRVRLQPPLLDRRGGVDGEPGSRPERFADVLSPRGGQEECLEPAEVLRAVEGEVAGLHLVAHLEEQRALQRRRSVTPSRSGCSAAGAKSSGALGGTPWRPAARCSR